MSKFKVFNAGLFLVLCVVGCSTQSTKTQNLKVQNAKAVPTSEVVCDKEPNKWAVFKKDKFQKDYVDSIYDIANPAYHPIIKQLEALKQGDKYSTVREIFGREPSESRVFKDKPLYATYKWVVKYDAALVGYSVRYKQGCMSDVSFLQLSDPNTLYIRDYKH